MIDLEQGDSEKLATCALESLKDAVPKVDVQWSERIAESLDYAFSHRTALALANTHNVDQLRELESLIHFSAAHARAFSSNWSDKWKGVASVLAARCANLDSQQPEALLQHEYVVPILDIISKHNIAGCMLDDIRRSVGLNPQIIDTVLNRMEANGLVVRRHRFRQVLYYLGQNKAVALTNG